MAGKLIGGPALRARLANVAAVPPAFAGEWADLTVDDIKATKPASRRPASSKFTARVTTKHAGVYGAFWWIFVDRGTKAHDIEIKNKKALSNRQTIFGKKVHLRRMGRRPFITKAARGALSELGTDIIVQAWNGRRRKRFAR